MEKELPQARGERVEDLQIVAIEKQYNQGSKQGRPGFVLPPLNLTIKEGEFFSLLGPSGCGKTTLLKLVAGLLEADGGEVWLGSSNITASSPESRHFGMVFQQSLLFPHMTVIDNVAFGLKMKGIGKQQRLQEAQQMLAQVGLAEFSKRYPSELSGGQQQRVSLARALVVQPRLLLMDEPFSALDPSLREEMRELLLRIRQQHKVTVLFVTHDREEAFQLSDRIGIMHGGQLLQVGTARELYEQPANSRIASFLGIKNIVPGTVVHQQFVSADGQLKIQLEHTDKKGKTELILRPELLQITADRIKETGFYYVKGTVSQLIFKQGFYICRIQVASYVLEALLTASEAETIDKFQEITLKMKVGKLALSEIAG